MTAQEERTVSLRKAESTVLKTIKTMATLSIGCSTTQLKAATIEVEKPMFTDLLKYLSISLTNALDKESHLLANMEAF
jgi:hypothetical protein